MATKKTRSTKNRRATKAISGAKKWDHRVALGRTMAELRKGMRPYLITGAIHDEFAAGIEGDFKVRNAAAWKSEGPTVLEVAGFAGALARYHHEQEAFQAGKEPGKFVSRKILRRAFCEANWTICNRGSSGEVGPRGHFCNGYAVRTCPLTAPVATSLDLVAAFRARRRQRRAARR